jgi:kinesin family protein 3/17
MEGVRDVPKLRGIIPNSFEHIFSHIHSAGTGVKFLVRASYLEIYNEEVRDLLCPGAAKLELKEHPDAGVYVRDLSSFVVKDVGEMDNLMNQGNKNRSVGFTEMNARSSRSHSIFTITIEMSEMRDGKECIRMGKLNLVDLAGSERQTKTGATGDRLKEASKINLSLSCLGNVIKALVDGKSSHIPYRDSKLTRLLQDSLGGNAKTIMIATLSPASYNYDETISTLRYASRAKNIKNKPKVNEDPKDAMLRTFQEEIARLRAQLEAEEDTVGEREPTPEEEPDTGSEEQLDAKINQIENRSKENLRSSKSGIIPGRRSSLSVAEMKMMEESIEREKQLILASKDMIESEKNSILAELSRRQDEIDTERKARQELVNKLEQMESKLLVGGVNILDKEEQQRAELARQAAELEQHRQQQLLLQEQMEQEEETALQMEEEYNSLQEEATAKTVKLKKLWGIFVSHRNELKDLTKEYQREREDLLDTIRELSRELKFKIKLVSHFVPDEELSWIESRSVWDDVSETWHIRHSNQAGNKLRGFREDLNSSPHELEARGSSTSHQHGNSWVYTYPNEKIYLTYEKGNKNWSNNALEATPNGSVNSVGSTNSLGFSIDKGNYTSSKKSIASPHSRPQAAKLKGSAKGGGRSSAAMHSGSKSPNSASSNFTTNKDIAPTARGLVAKPKHYA